MGLGSHEATAEQQTFRVGCFVFGRCLLECDPPCSPALPPADAAFFIRNRCFAAGGDTHNVGRGAGLLWGDDGVYRGFRGDGAMRSLGGA